MNMFHSFTKVIVTHYHYISLGLTGDATLSRTFGFIWIQTPDVKCSTAQYVCLRFLLLWLLNMLDPMSVQKKVWLKETEDS